MLTSQKKIAQRKINFSARFFLNLFFEKLFFKKIKKNYIEKYFFEIKTSEQLIISEKKFSINLFGLSLSRFINTKQIMRFLNKTTIEE